MTEAEFLDRWHAEQSVYAAWGNFVRQRVELRLKARDATLDLDSFIKVPARPRIKTDDSLLGKAFHRDKKYVDPYAQIEDKVGVRFVVLLKERFTRQYSYRQPWILLAYLLASQKPAELRERWPIGMAVLEPVYTDLGRQFTSGS